MAKSDSPLLLPSTLQAVHLPKIQSVWEVQSGMFMEGLRDQVRSLEKSLKADQELVMSCWHGQEKLQVTSISMPSDNVVTLHCLDGNGNQTQIVAHMSAVTFSFSVVTLKPPVTARKIGFSMPRSS